MPPFLSCLNGSTILTSNRRGAVLHFLVNPLFVVHLFTLENPTNIAQWLNKGLPAVAAQYFTGDGRLLGVVFVPVSAARWPVVFQMS